jgi:hypothetical protein
MKRFVLPGCLIIFFISPVLAQVNDSIPVRGVKESSPRSFGLFENEGILDITLKFDLLTYLRKKPKDEYLKTEITISDGNDSIKRDIRLRTRGIFRNSHCNFPPIELSFKKVDFGYYDLNHISKLKLVPECKSSVNDEAIVLKEYLAYKLFNVFTDTSFRVRLCRIRYIDSENNHKPSLQYGFFIEPLEILTRRTGTIQVKATRINQKYIRPFDMDRLALFNYMIGNYDWSIPGQHNVKVVKAVDPAIINGIAIPYDFDWSGLVNAYYAIPDESVGVESVKKRLFLGICRKDEVFKKDLIIFNEKKEDLYRIINDFPYLKQREKKEITDYLDEFFSEIKGKGFLFHLQNTCKRF